MFSFPFLFSRSKRFLRFNIDNKINRTYNVVWVYNKEEEERQRDREALELKIGLLVFCTPH